MPRRRERAHGERVLVTDVEERAMLAVCRGLARAGYRVSGVAGTRPAAGHWSRSVARRLTLPNPRLDPDGFVVGLARIAAEGEHSVLVPGVDAAVLVVSERRELFEPHVRLGLPPHEVVRRCLEKPALFAAAERAGLAAPASVSCDDLDEGLAAAARLGYPVVVKPAQTLFREERRTMTAAFAADEVELRALAPRYGSPFTIQRRETGAVVSCGGVYADGALLGLCVARYGRMWPPEGGSASLSCTIEAPPGLVPRLEALLADLGWQGIFELELVETAEGRLAAIDFNPRAYGTLTLAVEAGANLAALWCDWLLGRSPAPARARPGLRYRWEEAELLNLAAAVRRRSPRAALEVAKPHRGTTHAFSRLADPAPLLARGIGLLRSRL